MGFINREGNECEQKVISGLLEQEIVHHYYLKKGINEWSFENDPSLLKGVELITALK